MYYKNSKFYTMKKTLLTLGLFILSLTMSLTSCKKDKNDEPNLTENSITISNDVYPIKSAYLIVDEFENEVDLKFYCDELDFTIDLDGYKELPDGTFELKREGKYTAEADMRYSDKDYDVTGSLTISRTDEIFNITVIGDAYKDRAAKDFTLSYKGEISSAVDR